MKKRLGDIQELVYTADRNTREMIFFESEYTNSGMPQLKLKEYSVDESHLSGRNSLQITVPVSWLRDWFKDGGRIGIFIDVDHQNELRVKSMSGGESLPASASVRPEDN